MKTLLSIFSLCLLAMSCKAPSAKAKENGIPNDSLLTIESLTEARFAIFPDFASPLWDTNIKHFLKFEFIDKGLYDLKHKDSVNFLVMNEHLAKKEDSIISLPSRDILRIILAGKNDTKLSNYYNLLGEFPFLNRYVVSATYLEDYKVKLIDKATGGELEITDYPYISADKRHLLSVVYDDYASSAEIHLYKISGTAISNVVYASIDNWQPAVDENNHYYPMFFAGDNYFYLAIRRTEPGYNSYRKAIGPVQYVRFRVIPD